MRRSCATAALIFVTLALVFILSAFKISNYDLWWHIRVGREIVRNLEIPREDIFSFTAAGRKWVNHSWLAGVILYLIYQAGGGELIVAVKALVAVMAMGILLRAMVKQGVSLLAAVITIIFATFVLRAFLFARPLVATLLFLALYVHILGEYWRLSYSDPRGRRPFTVCVTIPLIMILWVNLHAGFAAGAILLGVYTACELALWCIPSLSPRLRSAQSSREKPVAEESSRRFPWLLLASALAIACTLLNPFGYEVPLYPFRLIGKNVFMQNIREWMSPLEGHESLIGGIVEFAPFWLMSLACVIFMVGSLRSVRAPELLSFVVFFGLTLTARRHIGNFAIIAAPILARHADDCFRRLLRFIQKKSELFDNIQKRLYPTIVHIGLSTAVASLCTYAVVFNERNAFGFGLKDYVYPTKAIDFIQKNKIPGRMFNEYVWGGYILWRCFPERKVFIDGRCLVYGEHIYKEWDKIYTSANSWEQMLEKRDVNFLLLRYNRPSLKFYESIPARWRVIYWDDISMVCVKNRPRNAELIDRFACDLSNPATIAGKLVKRERIDDIIKELDRKIAEDPECAIAYDSLGQCYIAKKNYGRADELLDKSLELHKRRAETHYHLGYVYYVQGKLKGAIDEQRAAIKIRPRCARYHHSLADSYRKKGALSDAVKEYKRAIQLDPNFFQSRVQLAALYNLGGNKLMAIKELERANRTIGGDPGLEAKIRELKGAKVRK